MVESSLPPARTALEGQRRFLRMLAHDAPLQDQLEALCALVESLMEPARCLAMALEGTEPLVLAAPGLPAALLARLREDPSSCIDWMRQDGPILDPLFQAHGLHGVQAFPIETEAEGILGALFLLGPLAGGLDPLRLEAMPLCADCGAAAMASHHRSRLHRRAVEELDQDAEFLRALLGHLHEAIVACDAEGALTVLNPVARRILAQDAEPGVDWTRHCDLFEKDGATPLPPALLPLDRAFRGEVFRGQELVAVPRGGVPHVLLANGQPIITSQGHKAGAVVVLHDITEREETRRELEASQNLLHGIMDHTPALVFLKDPQGRYLMINRRFAEVLGREAADILGRSADEIMAPDSAQATRASDRQLLEEGRNLEAEELIAPLGGEPRLFLSLRFPLRDPEGRIVALGGIATDITERRKTDEMLRQSQKLESLGILAGGIAHDFNNLLGAILGNAGLALMEASPNSHLVPYLRCIEGLTQKGSELTRQMLAYSGRGQFEVKPIQLNELLEEITHLLKVSVSKKAVIRLDLHRSLPTILADAAQIQQVVMNLVINASEAIGERSGYITISSGLQQLDADYLSRVFVRQTMKPGLYVTLEVSDNGAGMDAATMARIFDPFFSTKFTGRGLGLAAIQGIVRGHAGGIKVYSEQGKGSTFKILLPASETPPETRLEQEAAMIPRYEGTALVVEDEESIQAVMEIILARMGLKVLVAGDGRVGLRLFRERREEISFVLMDLTMPHMDGEELFREIRALDPLAKVILTSGYGEQETTRRFVGKGLAGFIQKPFKASDLMAKVGELLRPAE